MVEGKAGRFEYDRAGQAWRFLEGNFCRNQLCNLRVRDLLQQLDVSLSDEPAGTGTQAVIS